MIFNKIVCHLQNKNNFLLLPYRILLISRTNFYQLPALMIACDIVYHLLWKKFEKCNKLVF